MGGTFQGLVARTLAGALGSNDIRCNSLPGVEHANDFDMIADDSVEENIVSFDELPNSRPDILSRYARIREFGQHLGPPVELFENCVRGERVAFSNIEPDADEIFFRGLRSSDAH